VNRERNGKTNYNERPNIRNSGNEKPWATKRKTAYEITFLPVYLCVHLNFLLVYYAVRILSQENKRRVSHRTFWICISLAFGPNSAHCVSSCISSACSSSLPLHFCHLFYLIHLLVLVPSSVLCCYIPTLVLVSLDGRSDHHVTPTVSSAGFSWCYSLLHAYIVSLCHPQTYSLGSDNSQDLKCLFV
jgi:hypothetical protein